MEDPPNASENHPGNHRARRAVSCRRRHGPGTPASGVTAETARGPLVDRPLDVNWHFAARSKIKLQSQGPMEQAVQRIVAVPGATFGWHSHPSPDRGSPRS